MELVLHRVRDTDRPFIYIKRERYREGGRTLLASASSQRLTNRVVYEVSMSSSYISITSHGDEYKHTDTQTQAIAHSHVARFN